MLRGTILTTAAMLLTISSSSADDDRPRALAILTAKQAELDRLAKEVAELEQQLDQPTQAAIRYQLVSVNLSDWEQLNPTDDAVQENKAVCREWQNRLKDLIQRKKAVELSNSNVIVSNGKPARFVSGGQFPIPVPVPGSQKPGTMTVHWREFGQIVEALPVLKGNGRIDLQLSAEFSQLNSNHEVKVNDTKVPGLEITKLTSRVEARLGETFFVARGKRDDHMIFLVVTPERVK